MIDEGDQFRAGDTVLPCRPVPPAVRRLDGQPELLPLQDGLLLADLLGYFRYLGIGLAAVLIFIGGKMIGDPWVHISELISLLVVAGILLLALLASLFRPANRKS